MMGPDAPYEETLEASLSKRWLRRWKNGLPKPDTDSSTDVDPTSSRNRSGLSRQALLAKKPRRSQRGRLPAYVETRKQSRPGIRAARLSSLDESFWRQEPLLLSGIVGGIRVIVLSSSQAARNSYANQPLSRVNLCRPMSTRIVPAFCRQLDWIRIPPTQVNVLSPIGKSSIADSNRRRILAGRLMLVRTASHPPGARTAWQPASTPLIIHQLSVGSSYGSEASIHGDGANTIPPSNLVDHLYQ